MPKMRAVQVPRPTGPFEIVEREIPEPDPGSVRIKVQACGICHSDSVTKEGILPDMKSSGSWMLSVRVSLDGSPASVSELAGTEAIAGTVILVVEGTFSPARPPL
jgi:threonine dehydrogenase-like Zn-dependent dehydrogenase